MAGPDLIASNVYGFRDLQETRSYDASKGQDMKKPSSLEEPSLLPDSPLQHVDDGYARQRSVRREEFKFAHRSLNSGAGSTRRVTTNNRIHDFERGSFGPRIVGTNTNWPISDLLASMPAVHNGFRKTRLGNVVVTMKSRKISNAVSRRLRPLSPRRSKQHYNSAGPVHHPTDGDDSLDANMNDHAFWSRLSNGRADVLVDDSTRYATVFCYTCHVKCTKRDYGFTCPNCGGKLSEVPSESNDGRPKGKRERHPGIHNDARGVECGDELKISNASSTLTSDRSGLFTDDLDWSMDTHEETMPPRTIWTIDGKALGDKSTKFEGSNHSARTPPETLDTILSQGEKSGISRSHRGTDLIGRGPYRDGLSFAGRQSYGLMSEGGSVIAPSVRLHASASNKLTSSSANTSVNYTISEDRTGSQVQESQRLLAVLARGSDCLRLHVSVKKD